MIRFLIRYRVVLLVFLKGVWKFLVNFEGLGFECFYILRKGNIFGNFVLLDVK